MDSTTVLIMPKDSCMERGNIHSTDIDTCPNISERTRSSRKAGKASKETSRDVSPDKLWKIAIHICIFPYVCSYLWRALFQNAISANNKNRGWNANVKFRFMFLKRALHKYQHTYGKMHIWKTIFPNPIYELGIGTARPFLGMAFTAFWKRALHIYIYIYIYSYIFIIYIDI